MNNKPKLNYNQVKEYFSKFSCELLSEKYERTTQKLLYKCKCGKENSTTFANFKNKENKPICKFCCKKRKISYEEIVEYFSRWGCELLTKKEEYKGASQSLKFKCKCGRISFHKIAGILKKNKKTNCYYCGREKMKQNNLEKYGVEYIYQTEKFKTARKKVWRKKYGVDSPLKSDIIKQKRIKTVRGIYSVDSVSQSEQVKQTMRDNNKAKYGVEYPHQRPEVREKFLKTIQERYDVPNLAYLSRPASKQSQRLFWEIYNQLPKKYQTKTHFAELNKEFIRGSAGEYFKYDFVNTLSKTVIEFNGSHFHPSDFQKNEETNWCAFHPERTVKEAREYEQRKFKALEKDGYTFLVVWDYELKDETTIDKCIYFIRKVKKHEPEAICIDFNHHGFSN
jgi:G:T-mismatch repair DNA endonuclease (very short patch repair protein)